jgi:hypothetical protein
MTSDYYMRSRNTVKYSEGKIKPHHFFHKFHPSVEQKDFISVAIRGLQYPTMATPFGALQMKATDLCKAQILKTHV